MSSRTENRAEEIIRWYEYHKGTIPKENLVSRIEFQEKAINCLFELVVHLLEDIDPLEHKAGMRSKALWIPRDVKINGSLKRFG